MGLNCSTTSNLDDKRVRESGRSLKTPLSTKEQIFLAVYLWLSHKLELCNLAERQFTFLKKKLVAHYRWYVKTHLYL